MLKRCKYGHLKTGYNLILRPRTIRTTTRYTSKNGTKKTYHKNVEYVERVCRECLNDQRERSRLRKLGLLTQPQKQGDHQE